MSSKLTIRGIITDSGKLSKENSKKISEYLKLNIGSSLTIELSKYKKRSNPQNAYYWGVLIPEIREAMNNLGNDFSNQEVHDFLKKEFNYSEIEVNGHYVSFPKSTTELDTVSFMGYIDKCIEFASVMLNVTINYPNEQLTINYE